MLDIRNYNVSVDGKNIVSDFTFLAESGIHVIMGPNGSGKSSFAQSLMGNPNYDVKGEVYLAGKPIHKYPTHGKARSGLYASMQSPIEIPGISNFNFVIRALESRQVDFTMKNVLSTYKSLVDDFILPIDWPSRDFNVGASGGERKKNELLQIKMYDPTCIVLDEPDSGLDVTGIRILKEFIEELEAKKKVVIIISHQQQLINDLDPKSVLVLQEGEFTVGDLDTANKIFKEGFDSV